MLLWLKTSVSKSNGINEGTVKMEVVGEREKKETNRSKESCIENWE